MLTFQMRKTRQTSKRSRELGIPDEPESPPAKKRSIQRSRSELSRPETPRSQPRRIPGHEIINLDPEYVAKSLKPRTVDFPRFSNGSVYIQVAQTNSKYNYAFARSDL